MVDDRKEVLPLRVVAARFINADEEIGLAELDRITADASRAIQKRYWIWTSSFMMTALVTAGAVLIGGALTVGKAPGADLATLIGLGGAALMIAIGASWRVFQYGGMKARSPQSPVYADQSDLAVRNLERLFAILQLESTSRPFYYSRNGARRYVDHRYFFGKLRAAHVAKDNTKDGNEFLARAKAICERASSNREEIEFESLANELMPKNPKRLTDHLGNTDRALSDRFVPDRRALASLVRFKGGTKQWKVEFDRDAVSSRAVIYDPKANTLTLTGLPNELVAQLQSEGLGHG